MASTQTRFEAASHAGDARPHDDAPPRKRRVWKWALLAAAFLAAMVVAAWSLGSSAAPTYVTAPVERGDVLRTVSATGMVNPVETVQVGSYVSGRIQDVSCDYNTKVSKGQVCAKIDSRSYEAAVAESSAAVATAQAQLAKDQANFDYQKLIYAHRAALVKSGATAQETADEAQSTYRQLQAQLQLDAAAVAQHEAERRAARVNLDYTDIISPVDGTVVSRSATVGQTVAASFQTPTLFLIAQDLTQMQVDVNVSEADIGEIRNGEKASFTVEAFPDRTFHGVITQVRQAPISVQNVITYDVVIKVANPDLVLKPGMTATAHIAVAEHDDVLRLPQQAVRFTPHGTASPAPADQPAEERTGQRVWILRGGRIERIPVMLGLADEKYVEVTGTKLAPGDQVVVGEHPAGEPPPSAVRES